MSRSEGRQAQAAAAGSSAAIKRRGENEAIVKTRSPGLNIHDVGICSFRSAKMSLIEGDNVLR